MYAAYSVTSAVWLASDALESFDISVMVLELFNLIEPVVSKLPVKNCFCDKLSPNLVLPVATDCVTCDEPVTILCAITLFVWVKLPIVVKFSVFSF